MTDVTLDDDSRRLLNRLKVIYLTALAFAATGTAILAVWFVAHGASALAAVVAGCTLWFMWSLLRFR